MKCNIYVKKVFDVVKNVIEQQSAIDKELAELNKKYSAGDITTKVKTAKAEELKQTKDNIILNAHHSVIAVNEEFAKAVKDSELVSGDMICSDAKLFESGIILTENQLQNLIEKHKENPFMIQLIREHCMKNRIFLDMPLCGEEKIRRFDEYCNSARYSIYSPNSLQAGFFLAGNYAPELDSEKLIEL